MDYYKAPPANQPTSNEKPSLQQRIISRLSNKSDKYKFITQLEDMSKHEELYALPHIRQMLSQFFEQATQESKHFCSEVITLRNSQNMTQSTSETHLINYQQLANQQAEAEKCYTEQVNFYLDTVNGLGRRYQECKNICMEEDQDLKKQIQIREANQSKSTEFFHPISTNICMKECRKTFFFLLKRTNKYLVKDKGFYIESSKNYM